MDVDDFLQKLGLQQYEAAFRDNGIDIRVLPILTAEDLKDVGVAMVGHRRLLLEEIAALRTPTAPALEAHANAPHAAPMQGTQEASTAEAERRQVTVMFCDLTGSAALSSRLDPEDLREVIRAYQACVATTIDRFDGLIARYVGDGVLIYFGWPEARETDAERAVHAALSVAAAVSKSPLGGEPLQVHIGIATGLVVVGEPIGSGDSRQQTVIGETPNLAARLQGLAGPNQVVIDATTRRQIGGLFDYRDLGDVALKGFAESVPAWQVLGTGSAESRFEALHRTVTALVGRDEEMELLLRRWAQAKAGNGRVVLILAEPGVGKSRLAEALAERIAAEPHVRLRYFCSPHHQDSAFYPVIAQMERAAGFAHADGPAIRLSKLQAMFAATAAPIEDVALIADLHSLPSADLAPPLVMTPQRKKEMTFEALLRQVEGFSRQLPVLMMFDDLHWIDPSSHELLDRTLERIADWPVLLLATFRPEFMSSWTGQPHVTMLALTRLDRRSTAAMVANVAGYTSLPPAIVEEIVERTDGVPLFIEELTKAVIESGVQAPATLSSAPRPALSVPATLQASLMARLDRLGPAAKDIAQIGAAIGREFGHGLLAATTDLPEPQLREALYRLTNAGLVFVRGTPPECSYLFRHALVQDMAYGTLLRDRRRRLHSRIAATLEDQFQEIVLAQPAQLAKHCAEAGLTEKAVGYWLRAGQQALARSAMAEAAARLQEALRILPSLLESTARQRKELELQIALGIALIGANGYSAPGTGVALERSRALSDQLGDTPNFIRGAHGQWMFHLMRAEMKEAGSIAQELLDRSEQDQTVDLRLNGHRLVGATLIQIGQVACGCMHLETAQLIIDECRYKIGDITQGNDALVGVPAFRAIGLALLGRYSEARKQSAIALAEADRAARPHRKAFALAVAGSWFHGILNEDVPDLHNQWGEIVEELEFPFWHAFVTAWRGLRAAMAGAREEGIVMVRKATARLMALGAVWGPPFFLGNAAQFAANEDRFPLLDEASTMVSSTKVVWFAPELERIRGALTRENGDLEGAEVCFRRSLEEARRQGSSHWELRTALNLVDLWLEAGRSDDARALLSPIYAGFEAQGETDDLRKAATFLRQL